MFASPSKRLHVSYPTIGLVQGQQGGNDCLPFAAQILHHPVIPVDPVDAFD